MRRITNALVMGCLLLVFSLYAADKPADFSGVWKLNKDKSTLPAGSSIGGSSSGYNSQSTNPSNTSSSVNQNTDSNNTNNSETSSMDQTSRSTTYDTSRTSRGSYSSSGVSLSDMNIASTMTIQQTKDSLIINKTLSDDVSAGAGSTVREVVVFNKSGNSEFDRSKMDGTGTGSRRTNGTNGDMSRTNTDGTGAYGTSRSTTDTAGTYGSSKSSGNYRTGDVGAGSRKNTDGTGTYSSNDTSKSTWGTKPHARTTDGTGTYGTGTRRSTTSTSESMDTSSTSRSSRTMTDGAGKYDRTRTDGYSSSTYGTGSVVRYWATWSNNGQTLTIFRSDNRYASGDLYHDGTDGMDHDGTDHDGTDHNGTNHNGTNGTGTKKTNGYGAKMTAKNKQVWTLANSGRELHIDFQPNISGSTSTSTGSTGSMNSSGTDMSGSTSGSASVSTGTYRLVYDKVRNF